MNEADVKIDALNELAASLIRSGAPVDAVQKFVDTVNRALPPRREGPSRRQEIVDSALEMADGLVHTRHEFLRKVVHSAGKSLSESDRTK